MVLSALEAILETTVFLMEEMFCKVSGWMASSDVCTLVHLQGDNLLEGTRGVRGGD